MPLIIYVNDMFDKEEDIGYMLFLIIFQSCLLHPILKILIMYLAWLKVGWLACFKRDYSQLGFHKRGGFPIS